MPPSPLLSIIAHARSGALDQAWRLFREAGLEGVDDDAAVLSLHGRLLKDQALATPAGAGRREHYRQAARAYGRAGELSGTSYPLINAASLALLAGDEDQARRRARALLGRMAAGGEDEPDTPYYRAATRAEALLLLGDALAARTALAEAVALAPRAWEDHASTLRQFALILEAQGGAAGWLDAHRPPRALHFAGHMALAPDTGDLARQVRTALEEENVGFGFGALAAGADLVVAEALLDHGAELHLVLPAAPSVFRARSVDPLADGWGQRFDAVLARADSLRVVGHPDDPQHPLAVQLAAEVAMGQAVMQARTLMSQAVQLLVLDHPQPEPGQPGGSAWIQSSWRRSGRRGRVILAPRAPDGPPPGPMGEAGVTALAAMLTVRLAGAESGLAEARRLVLEALPRLDRVLAAGPAPLTPPAAAAGDSFLAFATPGEAARLALDIIAALAGVADVRIGGHYGLAARAGDRLLGEAAALPGRIARSAPPGAVHLTGDFAAALHAAGTDIPRTEPVGELPGSEPDGATSLFSLKA